jgi:CRP-like cAMP-binding protein
MQQLSDSSLVAILTDPQVCNKTFTCSNGEVIYQPDDLARNVYVIRRGQVRLYAIAADGSARLLEILGSGTWFGAAALARSQSYGTRAVAVGSAMIGEVPVERLLAALTSHPTQLLELTRQLAARLLSAQEEASRLVFEDCNQRLVSALLRFSTSAASTPCDDGVVLRITHDQLAQAVGVARETVSLALTQLRQQNLLQTGRNQLVFNPDTLRQSTQRVRVSSGLDHRQRESDLACVAQTA